MAEYPIQEKPLYGFSIDEDGSLLKHVHTRYMKCNRNGVFKKVCYKFVNGSRVVTKEEGQLDRYLNSYFYTFDSDPERALAIIKETLRDKMIKCQAEFQAAEAVLSKIDRAQSDEDGEDL